MNKMLNFVLKVFCCERSRERDRQTETKLTISTKQNLENIHQCMCTIGNVTDELRASSGEM